MALTRLGALLVKREATRAVAEKPTHAIRFKDGDVMSKQEIIANNPIQNNRWLALNAVKGKITADGSYNFDFDYNEAVHIISAAMGKLTTTDVGSTAGAVFSHFCEVANSIPSLTIEQIKGDPSDTSNNRQNYMVDRAYGSMIDEFSIQGSDGIVALAAKVVAHGVFQKSNLISDTTSGAAKVLKVATAEGLATGDSINIYDATPQNEVTTVSAINIATREVTATLAQAHTVANKAKIELVPQVVSFSTPAEVATFVHARFQFGATVSAAASSPLENVEDWEVTYQNNLEQRYGSLRASPSVIAPKGAKCTLKFKKYFESVVDRDRYLDQEKRGVILTLTNDKIIAASDTNQTKYALKLEFADFRYTQYEIPTGTDDLYAASCEGEAYYDMADGFAVRATFKNAKAGTEYTA